MVRLKDEMPKTWTLATVAGQRETAEREEDIVGYGVDCGVGCFADLDAMHTLMASPDIYAWLQEQVSQAGMKMVDFQTGSAVPANIMTFSSGEGDGTYPSYFGYDADGNILCLTTDFGIIKPLKGEQAEAPNKDQLRLDL